MRHAPRRGRAALAALACAALITVGACDTPSGTWVTIPAGGTPVAAAPSPPAVPVRSPAAAPTVPTAPYLYLGGDNAPDPVGIMAATGVRWFTAAFILSHGTCDPQWDGSRPLRGGTDEATIDAIRHGGGDVVVSFGGQSGPWLERSCPTAARLAAAYQQVIDAYRLRAIDVDIEGAIYQDPTLRQRVIDALGTVRASNPDLAISITFPVDASGPDPGMIDQAAEARLTVDCWIAMPFDMGVVGQNMGALTQRLTDQLVATVQSAYGYPSDQAARHTGISSMNGITDSRETVTVADFGAMLAYAQRRHLGRFTFWAVNRDRPCAAGAAPGDTCSGVAQPTWAYTRIVAGYRG